MSNPNNFGAARRIPTVEEKMNALLQRLQNYASISPAFPISEIYISPRTDEEDDKKFHARRMQTIANAQAFFALNYAMALENSLMATVSQTFAKDPTAQA